jgi:hypothetical protein
LRRPASPATPAPGTGTCAGRQALALLRQLETACTSAEELARLKGAQTRSCSLSVLVEQAAKQVASLHSAAVILAQDDQPGGWVWRFQPKRPVGTMLVVALDVGPQDLLEVAAADDQQPVQALGADGALPAFGNGVGVGARIGVRMTSAPRPGSPAVGWVQGCACGRSRGPDRPRPFAPTGAGGSPLLLGSEGLAPLSEQDKEAQPWRPPTSTSKHASPQKARE